MHLRRAYFSLCFCLSLAAIFSSGNAAASPNSYFDMTEARSSDTSPFKRWTGMVARYDDQKKLPDNDCGKTRFHPCSILDWRVLLDSLHGKKFHEQLDAVNDWSNAHPYIEDIVNWGVQDYWETPYEFMEISGDCEDYAISKYYSMRALGIPEERLRVIIVQDLNLGGIIHAILGVYDDDDELWILDNQAPQVLPALKIYHYRPIYGINEEAWWQYFPKGG